MLRLLPLHSLTAEDLEDWDDLRCSAAEPNPFFERAFVTNAARALEAEDVHLLASVSNGKWIGCMPVLIEREAGLPMIASWKHEYSFLGTPLVDRDHLEEFATGLGDDLRRGKHASLLKLQDCGDGEILRAIRRKAGEAGARVVFEQCRERAVLPHRAPDQAPPELSGSRRRELRRKRRRLNEKLGGNLELRDRSRDPSAIDDFLALEASGWKGQGGTALATSEGGADLFRSICTALGPDRVQIVSLDGGGRTAAMSCSLSGGDSLFCFKIAFDETLRQYSPGMQLVGELTQSFTDRDERLMDSCAEPSSGWINSLWRDRRSLVTTVIGRPGATAHIAKASLGVQQAIRGRVRFRERVARARRLTS